jgi:hypothetical protein
VFIVEPVLLHRGYRYRIYPTPAQVERLTGWEAALRFLWNVANEQRVLELKQLTQQIAELKAAVDQG